ncbi:DUF6086 family protein [Actinomadura sp. WMMB 499]|uniref:DUF6086 family protein n=1 Tax=Actinomadura sp. WMMB 499 TaxID=1219491 RepID=UPI0012484E32|nr:DUF6086 family protein [Actinomadura sp. WMMB 499]QFG23203.1 hypothetical protein F7P10_20855 [Actinomadura sp. WMMB 499]
MSQYFQAGDDVLWNPATRVARLFAATAGTLADITDRPSGIGPEQSDEYRLDVETFVEFTDALVRYHARSGHTVMRTLMEGFVVTALALSVRAGVRVPALDDLDTAGVRALAERARDVERTMPR